MNKFMHALYDENIPYMIGETAYIHEGNFDYLMRLVREIVESACCDGIKFHVMVDVDSYITPMHELHSLYTRMKMSKEEWLRIFMYVKEHDRDVIVLADDKAALDFIKQNKNLVDTVELHAIALNNIEMLNCIKSIPKPLIFGVGGSQQEDINFMLDFIKRKDVLLMHGFQNYPTKYEFINLHRMQRLRDKYGLNVGYADHTIWNSEENEMLTLAGFIMGANILEKHVALEPGNKRIDYDSAISISLLAKIRKRMDILNSAKGDGSFEISDYENIYALNGPMKFTTVAARDLKKGRVLMPKDMTFKRTKEINTIKQREYLELIGKELLENVAKDNLLNWEVVKK